MPTEGEETTIGKIINIIRIPDAVYPFSISDLRDAIADALAREKAGRLEAETAKWRHVKTGGIYTIVSEGLLEADMTEVVVYRKVANGQIWVRPRVEFYDGRFVRDAPKPL
jgi:hypothetical protein